jgi:hypothetical protein
MAKISGTVQESTRIIIIDEDTWTIESNTVETGSYEITGLTSGKKTVIAQATDDYQTNGYGNITPLAE